MTDTDRMIFENEERFAEMLGRRIAGELFVLFARKICSRADVLASASRIAHGCAQIHQCRGMARGRAANEAKDHLAFLFKCFDDPSYSSLLVMLEHSASVENLSRGRSGPMTEAQQRVLDALREHEVAKLRAQND